MSHTIDAPGSSTFGISGSGIDNHFAIWNGTGSIDDQSQILQIDGSGDIFRNDGDATWYFGNALTNGIAFDTSGNQVLLRGGVNGGTWASAEDAGFRVFGNGKRLAVGDGDLAILAGGNLRYFKHTASGNSTISIEAELITGGIFQQWANSGVTTSRATITVSGAVTVTDAANLAWNMQLGTDASVTVTASRIVDNPTNIVRGMCTYKFTHSGAGYNPSSWGSAYQFAGGTAPTLGAVGAGQVDILFFHSDGTNLYHIGSCLDAQ